MTDLNYIKRFLTLSVDDIHLLMAALENQISDLDQNALPGSSDPYQKLIREIRTQVFPYDQENDVDKSI